jgi:5-phospho-D-xylono-1,4-lactonase
VKLQTVAGMVDVGEVTLADGHGHVWINPPADAPPNTRLELRNEAAIHNELVAFGKSGGSLIIDCQPGGCGRDARMLAQLSRMTGVHITATTGFHQQKYYPDTSWLWKATIEAATDYFITELTVGMRETDGTIPATILKVGYDGTITGQSKVLMEAVAAASYQTGTVILFHTEQGRNAEALLPFFEKHGIPPEHLYLCHVDKRPDVGLHRELAQAGVLLGYDTFVRPNYDPDHNVWPLLKQMVADGFEDHIAIGLDMAIASMWKAYGGTPGLSVLTEQIIPQLRIEGIGENAIKKLTGQNIARRLARYI